MTSTIHSPSKYIAIETSLYLSTVPVTVLTTDTLDSLFADVDQYHGLFKNITVTPPEGTIDQINLLGTETATGIGQTLYFQNALLEEKPYGLATITGTAVMAQADHLEKFFDPGASFSTASVTYDRYQFGIPYSTATLGRPYIAILVKNAHPFLGTVTKKANILLNNAQMTKIGDYRISGPDSHWEVDIAATCLPKDFYVEYIRE
jgi:hypothetical protein